MKLFPLLGLCAAIGVNAQPNLPEQASDRAKKVIAYWTPGRRRAAKPLDRVLEESADGSRQLMLRTGTNTKSTHRQLQTTVADGDWNAGGKINEAAGRLFFSINGSNYVCSASVVNDYGTAGRSLLATAAHCVYDESIDRFANNYLFIPKQDDGGTDASNRVCSDDYYGCWVPTHAVIDSRWATGTWSSNIPYDYALLVVPDSGAWTSGSNNLDNQVLDNAVPPVEVDFTNEQGLVSGSWVQFHGYSYNQDPHFRYCRVQANSQTDRWIVPGCMLSGGASGGPCQPNNDGNGKLYSVVSFSSSSGGVQTGMGGARLNSNSFSCLYETAKTTTGNTIYSYGGTPCPITSNVPPASGCTINSDCDNGLFCDGVETCSNGSCQSGSSPCTGKETCDETSDICLQCVLNSDCNNGLFCDGVETCSNGICRSGSNPCSNGQTCNETNDTCVTPPPVCSARSSTCTGRKSKSCTNAGCVWCGGSRGCFSSVVGGCTCPL
ncbi:hypothetical protein ACA910_015883 [Epithemia clementina (nom. ined.)]